jgi:Arc/MetJ-type ribon-helix-helix transcriptional regulator
MKKTTIYLPNDLKSELERISRAAKQSEAEIIRDAIRRLIQERSSAPTPRIPLFASDESTLADMTDEALAGFGER